MYPGDYYIDMIGLICCCPVIYKCKYRCDDTSINYFLNKFFYFLWGKSYLILVPLTILHDPQGSVVSYVVLTYTELSLASRGWSKSVFTFLIYNKCFLNIPITYFEIILTKNGMFSIL